jgi:hypothetical protein
MQAIDDFWRWWKGAADGLAAAYDSGNGLPEAQVEEISTRVKTIGDLAWETGPGRSSRHHFALSGEGDPALRVVAQRWLSRAPAPSEQWEFYAARQPSGPDLARSLTVDERVFVYGDFQLQLTRDDVRERFDLDVYHPSFSGLEEDSCQQPVFLMLDNVLGEDGVVSWIGGVEISQVPFADAVNVEALDRALSDARREWKGEKTWALEGKTEAGGPLVIVVKPSVKRLDHLLHDHCYTLTVDIVDPERNGLPDPEENDDLDEFEDALMQELGHAAVWIARETYEGKRVIHFHADPSYALQKKVETILAGDGRWDGELEVRYDPSWEILDKY